MDKYIRNKLLKKKPPLQAVIFLKIKAHSAVTGPPLSGILGQYSIPAAPFCEQFNNRTVDIKDNVILHVSIFLNINGEYKFNIKIPTTSFFFKRCLLLKKGLKKPGFFNFSNITMLNGECFISSFLIYEILLYKKNYSNSINFNSNFISTIKKTKGTLLSMGILICN